MKIAGKKNTPTLQTCSSLIIDTKVSFPYLSNIFVSSSARAQFLRLNPKLKTSLQGNFSSGLFQMIPLSCFKNEGLS